MSITKYFPSAPGPLYAPPPDADSWLPKEERGRSTKRLTTGELRKQCNQPKCPNHTQSLWRFAPRQSSVKEARFKEAMVHYEEARNHRNAEAMEVARGTIEKYMSAWCDHCRDVNAKTRFNNECYKTYVAIKALPQFSSCIKCGSIHAIELNHVGGTESKMKRTTKEGKEVALNLSDLGKWGTVGGPDAMWEETKLVEPLCKMCHTLDEHSRSSQRVDPSTLADVRCCDDEAAYQKKLGGFHQVAQVPVCRRLQGGHRRLRKPRVPQKRPAPGRAAHDGQRRHAWPLLRL